MLNDKLQDDFNDINSICLIRKITKERNVLPSFTIYQNTVDYPNEMVIRLSFIGKTVICTNCIVKANNLAAARKKLPIKMLGLYRFPKNNKDDDSIVETWM